MASGDITHLAKVDSPIVAMGTIAAGATVYFVTQGGNLKTYTIAGGAVATKLRLSSGDVTAMAVNGTHIYLAFHNGQVLRITIADNAQLEIAKFDCPVTGLYINTLIYVTLADGHIYSYEI